MDDLESSALPESSGPSSSPEAVKEKSEKQKESYKKAQAQLQKSQKDEKKAKGDNEDLFAILFRFIQNPFYEGLIPTITELLQMSTPSRYIIALTALVYPESALYVLAKLGKKGTIDALLSLHHYEQKEQFNEHTLHPSIRNWMSTWVQFSGTYLVGEGASHILEEKLLHLITEHKTRAVIEKSLSQFLYFFFASRNLDITTRVTDSYAEFILREYRKLLEKAVSDADPDLLGTLSTESVNLFGLG